MRIQSLNRTQSSTEVNLTLPCKLKNMEEKEEINNLNISATLGNIRRKSCWWKYCGEANLPPNQKMAMLLKNPKFFVKFFEKPASKSTNSQPKLNKNKIML